MKIIAMGDIHGRNNWKQIVNNESFDKVVFLGDYFDVYDNISFEEMKHNFEDLIEYKRNNLEKVVLLIGNHDYHYMDGVSEKYSRHMGYHKTVLNKLMMDAMKDNLLQICFIYENMLYVHAGITKTWCNKNLDGDLGGINDLFHMDIKVFGFTMGRNRSNYGDDITQSPIWVRPYSLLADKIDGFIQVVGHTGQDKIEIGKDVIFIDVLGTSGEYLIWDDFKISVGKNGSNKN